MDPAGGRRNGDSGLVCEALKAHTANAAEQMTICRRLSARSLKAARWSVSIAGRTIRLNRFFGYGEFIPQEYQLQV